MPSHKYSLVIPVYNRPDEISELLESVCNLEFSADYNIPFEVIIVEDGSTVPCKDIVDKYSSKTNVQYFILPENTGSAITPRNIGGAEKSSGDYLIFFDSDIILPPNYLSEVDKFLAQNDLDAFGGPDAAHHSFSNLQKAISYAMTSFFTTGGIRNKKKPLTGKYSPRGFNFGIKKDVFIKMDKFQQVTPGEDVLLGHSLIKANYKVGLIPNAVVFHKRKSTLKKYFKQVFLYGRGRVHLNIMLPDTTSFVHYLPALFVLGVLACLAGAVFCIYALAPLLLYAVVVFIDSAIRNKSVSIGGLSVITAYIQLFGYGSGFILEFITQHILGKKDKKIDHKYQI